MFYLVDENGQVLNGFEHQEDAERVMDEIVADEPEAADELAIIERDGRGQRVGEAITHVETETVA